MSLKITEKCIECGSCETFCKNEAIDFVDGKYRIDQERCDSCGTCREYCPIDDAMIEVEQSEATGLVSQSKS